MNDTFQVDMGMKCTEDPFNMGMIFCFIMVHFADPQHTHPGIPYWNKTQRRPCNTQDNGLCVKIIQSELMVDIYS